MAGSLGESMGSPRHMPPDAVAEEERDIGRLKPTGDSSDQTEPRTWHALLGILLFAGMLVAAYLLFRWIEPDSVPHKDDPTVLDTIFASTFVIAAARVVLLSAAVVLLFGGLYIAASTVHRMRHGQWLHRAGPFEAHLAEEAEEELEDVDMILELYAEAVEENEGLATRLAERDQQLEELAHAYHGALAELENQPDEEQDAGVPE
jgi:hypothetical protein